MELQNLLESASKDLKTLNELKNLAVKLGQYELGAECRRLEKELYPETEEEIEDSINGVLFNTIAYYHKLLHDKKQKNNHNT